MKRVDDGVDGLNEAAFDRMLGIKPRRARRAKQIEPWCKALIERTVAASKAGES
ncbi:MAG TPA: hypothetical protein VFQ42_21960 [Mycobacterium sp.]|nr:hypothetical protein [Mycobacterium sp.]